MTQEELYENNKLWDENVGLKHELAAKQVSLDAAFEGMTTIVDLTLLCLNHPNAKEHHIWRAGLLQALARVQKNLAEATEVEEEV